MSFSRMVLAKKKVDWQACFLFPNVGTKCCGEPIFHWNGEKWMCVGAGVVGMVSSDIVVDDPISAVIWTARSSKVVTRDGVTHNFPREYVEIFVWESVKYYVAAIPSVYTVMLNGSPFKILACFGYDVLDKKVMLFNVKNIDSEIYGVQMTNLNSIVSGAQFGLDADLASFSQGMPSYSGKGVVPKDKDEAQILSSQIEDLKNDIPYAPADVNDERLLELVESHLKKEAALKVRLLKLIDPTFETQVEYYGINGSKIVPSKRNRSHIERANTLGDSNIAGLEYVKKIREDAIRKLGVKANGSLPLPDSPKPVEIKPRPSIPLPKVDIMKLGSVVRTKEGDAIERDGFEIL